MRAVLFIISLTVPMALVSAPATADKLGDHPAIVAQRVHAVQGYDYASKFYTHPAWLYLLPEAPRPMMDHPAVIVFKRQQQEKALARAAALKMVAGDQR